MKTLTRLFVFVLFIICTIPAHAQEYGKIRAMQQRADQVVRMKNDFVVRVLTSYAIPHERNAQGIVTRINMEGRWLNVEAIDIVPVTGEAADKRQLLAYHELLFRTNEGVLDLLSDLAIR
jgi:hypothetical protein